MIAAVRRFAQALRHAPVLRGCDRLWNVLRGPYKGLLRRLGSARGVPVTVGGEPMRLHPDVATQNWETVEHEAYLAFSGMVADGAVVVDVGAHVGTYTIIAAARAGPRGRVVAYEPNGDARRYLEEHLRWNGVAQQVLVRSAGCGAQAGEAAFYHRPGLAEGMSGLVPVEGFARTTIPLVTLDAEMAEMRLRPAVIKIDVEGAELDVLRGAEATLSRHHPRLLLSLHPAALARQGLAPQAVLDWLGRLGYAHRILCEDHEVHVAAWRRGQGPGP